jgi:hypothetical protein
MFVSYWGRKGEEKEGPENTGRQVERKSQPPSGLLKAKLKLSLEF